MIHDQKYSTMVDKLYCHVHSKCFLEDRYEGAISKGVICAGQVLIDFLALMQSKDEEHSHEMTIAGYKVAKSTN